MDRLILRDARWRNSFSLLLSPFPNLTLDFLHALEVTMHFIHLRCLVVTTYVFCAHGYSKSIHFRRCSDPNIQTVCHFKNLKMNLLIKKRIRERV